MSIDIIDIKRELKEYIDEQIAAKLDCRAGPIQLNKIRCNYSITANAHAIGHQNIVFENDDCQIQNTNETTTASSEEGRHETDKQTKQRKRIDRNKRRQAWLKNLAKRVSDEFTIHGLSKVSAMYYVCTYFC